VRYAAKTERHRPFPPSNASLPAGACGGRGNALR
jgi:hypothetical protein